MFEYFQFVFFFVVKKYNLENYINVDKMSIYTVYIFNF